MLNKKYIRYMPEYCKVYLFKNKKQIVKKKEFGNVERG